MRSNESSQPASAEPMGAGWCQDGSRDALSRGDVLCDGVTGWTGGQTKTQTSNDLRTNASTRVLVRLWPSPLFLAPALSVKNYLDSQVMSLVR